VDLRFNQDVEMADLPRNLQAAMPSGIRILNAEIVDEQAPALQTLVVAAEYQITLTGGLEAANSTTLVKTSLMKEADDLMAKSTLPRERRGKAYDLRPLIENLAVISENKIIMRLTARPAATGRPEEVLDALGIAIENTRIERTSLIFQG
jgi:radical SAM-linked protein